MVQTVNVQTNGNAPSGLQTGDIVNTAGGQYIIATPGSPGASYNPDSNYWSVRLDSDEGALLGAANASREAADLNSQRSQEFAREQMQFQSEQNAKAMAFNAEEAQKNRDFQTWFHGSSHQREVADLIAAGLNPILSANSGASTTSGATASGVTSAGASGVVDNSATNSMLNAVMQFAQMENQMDMTRLSAAAGIQQAQLSAGAMAYSALMNYNAAVYSSNMTNTNQKELLEWKTLNPDNPTQAITRFLNKLASGDGLNSGSALANMTGSSLAALALMYGYNRGRQSVQGID